VERVEQGTTLVDQAGTTMQEVVASIRQVTEIMGNISAASNDQAQGVASVGEAVMQMDQATQQNAALVEEMAAAAASLNSQAQELVQTVAVFKDTDNGMARSSYAIPMAAPTPRAYKTPAKRPVIAPTKRPALAPRAAAPKPALAPTPRPMAAAKPPQIQASTPAAAADDEWETF